MWRKIKQGKGTQSNDNIKTCFTWFGKAKSLCKVTLEQKKERERVSEWQSYSNLGDIPGIGKS